MSLILGGIGVGGVIDWEDELGVDCFEVGGVSRVVGVFVGIDMGGFVGCFVVFSCFFVVDWVICGKVGVMGEMGIKGEEEVDDVLFSFECSVGGVEYNEEFEWLMIGFGLCFFVVFVGILFGWVCMGGGGFFFFFEECIDGVVEVVFIFEMDFFMGVWMIFLLCRMIWWVVFFDGFGNLVLNEVLFVVEVDMIEFGV